MPEERMTSETVFYEEAEILEISGEELENPANEPEMLAEEPSELKLAIDEDVVFLPGTSAVDQAHTVDVPPSRFLDNEFVSLIKDGHPITQMNASFLYNLSPDVRLAVSDAHWCSTGRSLDVSEYDDEALETFIRYAYGVTDILLAVKSAKRMMTIIQLFALAERYKIMDLQVRMTEEFINHVVATGAPPSVETVRYAFTKLGKRSSGRRMLVHAYVWKVEPHRRKSVWSTRQLKLYPDFMAAIIQRSFERIDGEQAVDPFEVGAEMYCQETNVETVKSCQGRGAEECNVGTEGATVLATPSTRRRGPRRENASK